MYTEAISQPKAAPGAAGRLMARKKRIPFLVQSLRWLDARSPVAVCIIGVLMVLGIYVLSNTTGPHLSSSLFYLVPVLLMTRVAGFKAGSFAAFAATSLWLYRDLKFPGAFEKSYAPYWNSVMRLGTWMIVVSLVSAMRLMNAHLKERVLERTSELEAQIAEKRELEASILEISDRERARVGQDLHDGLCQHLVSAAFSANMLKELVIEKFSPGIKDVDNIANMIDNAITQARNLARGLYPVRLEVEGLEMALRELASTVTHRFEIPCMVKCPRPLPPCKPSVAIHLYRIAQEAAVNAVKHANASEITISLKCEEDLIVLSVEDNGIGLGGEAVNPVGMGLCIMEYRARMIGSIFKIGKGRHSGVLVFCKIPQTLYNS